MKKHKILLIYALTLTYLLCSCQSSSQLTQITSANTTVGDNIAENIDGVKINQAAVDALSLIKTQITPDVSNNIPSNGRYQTFFINNGIYLCANTYGNAKILYEINYETGTLEDICRDPLCAHQAVPCINKYVYNSFTTNGTNLYVLSGYTDDGNGVEFVGILDPVKGEIKMLDTWQASLSANSLSFVYYDDYLYYTKSTSDTTNEIYSVSVKDGKAKKVSAQDEHIVVFAISDGIVYYRNNSQTMKSTPLDFSSVKTIAEKVSIIRPIDNIIYFFDYGSAEDGSGYNLLCVSSDNLTEIKTVLNNVYSPSQTYFADGKIYYCKSGYSKDKKLFIYDIETELTTALSVNYGDRAFVLGSFDYYLLANIAIYNSEKGDFFDEYYLISQKDGSLTRLEFGKN